MITHDALERSSLVSSYTLDGIGNVLMSFGEELHG